MDCLAHIVKYILYIFNLIFVLCGIVLIALGSVILHNIGDISSFQLAFNPKTIPILIIILGCIVFVIAFFGCCGAIQENTCCTTIYSTFMFILLVLQIALVAWIFVKRQEFLKTMSNAVDEAWNKNDESNGYPMDVLQMTFDCCGLTSYTNYLESGKTVPNSCCGSKSEQCQENVYTTKLGCRKKFVDFWASNTNIIRYVGIGVALVELVAFIFAACLVRSIRESKHRM